MLLLGFGLGLGVDGDQVTGVELYLVRHGRRLVRVRVRVRVKGEG